MIPGQLTPWFALSYARWEDWPELPNNEGKKTAQLASFCLDLPKWAVDAFHV